MDGKSDNADDSRAIKRLEILKKLTERNVFNCQSCEAFFESAVYCVYGEGVVCYSCFRKNRWQGRRLRMYEAALQDLPVVPCPNADAGCCRRVMPEDLEAHLVEHCKYRLVDCLSPGCSWQSNQDDLTKHFEETHAADVINGATAFNLDIARESFVVVKLFIAEKNKYFVVIKREPDSKHISYDVFKVAKEDDIYVVTIKHCWGNTDVCTKEIDAVKELNMIDKTLGSSRINVIVLKELSGGRSKLSLAVDVKLNQREILEKWQCVGCMEFQYTRRLRCQCRNNHDICTWCWQKARYKCPVCQMDMDAERKSVLAKDEVFDLQLNHAVRGTDRILRTFRCPFKWDRYPYRCTYKCSSEELLMGHMLQTYHA